MSETTILDPKRTTINLANWIKSHNEKYPYAERKNRIRGGTLLTVKCILSDFIKAYAKGKTSNGYYETSTALIAEFTIQSVSAVRRHIKRLEELGFIVDIKRTGAKGNNYQIKFINEFFDYITERVDEAKETHHEVSEEMTEEIVNTIATMIHTNPKDMVQTLSKAFMSPTKQRRNTS